MAVVETETIVEETPEVTNEKKSALEMLSENDDADVILAPE